MKTKLQPLYLAFVILCFLAPLALFTGCTGERIQGGHSMTDLFGLHSVARQSDDPKEPTSQNVVSDMEETRLIPAGSRLITGAGTNKLETTIAAPMLVTTKRHQVSDTRLGAAQKNVLGETIAKLKSLRWVQFCGLGLALFGLASLFWPPLRLLVNSVTTSVWCLIGGAALIFLPVVIVGHEVLILAVVGGVVALWFFAHRHGGMAATVAELKSQLPTK